MIVESIDWRSGAGKIIDLKLSRWISRSQDGRMLSGFGECHTSKDLF